MRRWTDLPLRTRGALLISAPLVPAAAAALLLSASDAIDGGGASRATVVLLTVVAIGAAVAVAAVAAFARIVAAAEEPLGQEANRLAGEPQAAPRRAAEPSTELAARLEAAVHRQQALEAELDSLAHAVSHDLRAPLRHVTGFAALLEEHAAGTLDAEGRRLLATVTGAAARLTALIDGLLALSRAGRAELLVRPVDLGAVVRQALQDAAPEAWSRTIEWRIEPLPPAAGDRELLLRAFTHLLSNAVKYSRPREAARIEVAEGASGPDEVIVYVRDNGVGFDMKHADRLFGVFQRLHPASAFDGIGIGLALVRRIVQRHGGRVWAESAPDRGATFYVSLPRSVPG